MNEYFKNNREQFDNETLPEGHREVFLNKLKNYRRKSFRIRNYSIAAVFGLLIMSGLLIRQQAAGTPAEGSFILCHQQLPEGISPEIVKADEFYSSRLYNLQKVCFYHIPVNHFLARNDYIHEMSKYYNARCQLYGRLEKDPANQSLHSALIRQYQIVEQQQVSLVDLLSKPKR